MALFDRLSFADGYVSIEPSDRVVFDDDTPHDIVVKFWKEWPEYRREAIALQKKGIHKSSYHYFHDLEHDINEDQYKDLQG